VKAFPDPEGRRGWLAGVANASIQREREYAHFLIICQDKKYNTDYLNTGRIDTGKSKALNQLAFIMRQVGVQAGFRKALDSRLRETGAIPPESASLWSLIGSD
jgi:hypothetical protein